MTGEIGKDVELISEDLTGSKKSSKEPSFGQNHCNNIENNMLNKNNLYPN